MDVSELEAAARRGYVEYEKWMRTTVEWEKEPEYKRKAWIAAAKEILQGDQKLPDVERLVSSPNFDVSRFDSLPDEFKQQLVATLNKKMSLQELCDEINPILHKYEPYMSIQISALDKDILLLVTERKT